MAYLVLTHQTLEKNIGFHKIRYDRYASNTLIFIKEMKTSKLKEINSLDIIAWEIHEWWLL